MSILSAAAPNTFLDRYGGFLEVIEKGLVLLFLLLFSEGLLGRIFASEENPEGGAFLRMLWIPVYVYALGAMIVLWRRVLTVFVKSPALFFLSAMAIASHLWSIDPDTSFRRGIAIFFTTGFGVYLACRFSWKDMLSLLGIAWIILGIGNLIAGAATPSFGIMAEIHPGAWKGIWFEKNQLGGHMSRASFLFAFLALVDVKRRNYWIFGTVLSVVLVLLSTSKTSLLGMLLGFSVLAASAWMSRGKVRAMVLVWIAVAGIFAAGMLLMVAPEAVVAVIGRDLTLTGRTDIWAALFEIMEERPWLGFGYASFWGEFSAPAFQVRLATEWPVPTAHNGILEVMLALGRVGAILFLIDYFTNVGRALRQSVKRKSGVFAFGFFALFALFSVSESIILMQNGILWVTYAAVVGRLSLDAAADRVSASSRILAWLDKGRVTGVRPAGAVALRRRRRIHS